MDRDSELEEPQLPIFLDSSISQQTIRSEYEGDDCLNITTRAVIPAGADRHVIHIAICPAMSTIPEVDAYVISGTEARIRVTQRQKFGVRLELIVGEVSEHKREAILEVVARSKKQNQSGTTEQSESQRQDAA